MEENEKSKMSGFGVELFKLFAFGVDLEQWHGGDIFTLFSLDLVQSVSPCNHPGHATMRWGVGMMILGVGVMVGIIHKQ